MFLKQSRYKNGRVFLSIVEGFRVRGKMKSRTVESLGYLDQLEKMYEDPVSHFKAHAAELTLREREENKPVVLEFSPLKKIDMREENVVNLGYAVLSHYYHKLKLDTFWDNRRSSGNFSYNPNAIFKLLTYSRVLDPASKKRSFERKDRFLERTDFSLDDLYRSLSFISSYERDLTAWIDAHINSLRKRDYECIYYDVTNYYFEIEDEDELRRRGVSKEHRPSPIVQMGLLLDSDGIPLDYQLFSGNTNDCLTLLPHLKDLKKRHLPSRVIVVADKGLNTSDNIAANMLDGNGFVFSQSVKGANREMREWIISAAGYSGDDTFKIKERISTKKVTVSGAEGKRRSVEVEVKEVAFWSRDFEKRSRSEREKVIEKSRAAVARREIGSAQAKTAQKYILDTAVVKATGEVADHVYELDTEKIKREEQTDGYYCIITSELDKSATEIIEIYRGLWKIEETFRVTKSTLEARPVYVSRQDRIRAHFMICYTALVLLRLVQADLGWEHSASEIAEDLSQVQGTLMQKNYYLFGHRTHLTDKLSKLCGIDLSRKILTLGQMRNIIAKTKKR